MVSQEAKVALSLGEVIVVSGEDVRGDGVIAVPWVRKEGRGNVV